MANQSLQPVTFVKSPRRQHYISSKSRDEGTVTLNKVRNNAEFADLHVLFEKIFSTPSTWAPISTSGMFMRPHRALMGNKLPVLSELVMIKCNLKHEPISSAVNQCQSTSDGFRWSVHTCWFLAPDTSNLIKL